MTAPYNLTIFEKREMYSLQHLHEIEKYKAAFVMGVESYGSGISGVFTRELLNVRDKIALKFNLDVTEVCSFAFNYEEFVRLLNGRFTSAGEDHLYFIESADAIKIGRTGNLKQRLCSLQIAQPEKLSLRAVFHRRGVYEFHIHAIFDYLRLSGEWFKKHDDIYHYIELLEQNNDKYLIPVTEHIESWKSVYKGNKIEYN